MNRVQVEVYKGLPIYWVPRIQRFEVVMPRGKGIRALASMRVLKGEIDKVAHEILFNKKLKGLRVVDKNIGRDWEEMPEILVLTGNYKEGTASTTSWNRKAGQVEIDGEDSDWRRWRYANELVPLTPAQEKSLLVAAKALQKASKALQKKTNVPSLIQRFRSLRSKTLEEQNQ